MKSLSSDAERLIGWNGETFNPKDAVLSEVGWASFSNKVSVLTVNADQPLFSGKLYELSSELFVCIHPSVESSSPRRVDALVGPKDIRKAPRFHFPQLSYRRRIITCDQTRPPPGKQGYDTDSCILSSIASAHASDMMFVISYAHHPGQHNPDCH